MKKQFGSFAFTAAVLAAGMFFSGIAHATVLEDQQIIDLTDPNAFVVRKDGAAGNVFIVDTSSTLVIAKASSSQTGNVFEVQDSSGTAVARFDKSANLQIGNGNYSYGGLKIGGSVGLSSQIVLQIDRNFNSGSAVYAVSGEILNSGVGDTYGLSYSARAHHSSGTMTNLIGIIPAWRATGGGTVTNAYSAKIGPGQVSGGSTVTNSYGVYIDEQKLGTNDYGLYIKDADTYAIWSDAGENRFDGTVRMGKGTKSGGLVVLPAVELQTTNNSATTLTSVTLDDNTTYHLSAQVVGIQDVSGNTNEASYHLEGTFYRMNGGSATMVGSATTVHSQESTGATPWSVTLGVSGNNAVVTVTGSSTVQWAGVVEHMTVSK